MGRISVLLTVNNKTSGNGRTRHQQHHHKRTLRANECVANDNMEKKKVSKLSESAVNAQKILQTSLDSNDNDKVLNQNKNYHSPPRLKKRTSSGNKTAFKTVKVKDNNNVPEGLEDGTHSTEEERDTNDDNRSISNTVAEAMEAVNSIREEFNRLEIEEKSKELEESIKPKELKLDKLNQDIKEVSLMRIRYNLQTPNSAITSTDAKYFLETILDNKKSTTIVDKMLNKVKKNYNTNKITNNNDNILALEDAEEKCFTKISDNSILIDKANFQKQTLSNAKKKVKEAKKAEDKARKALIAAEGYTISCNKVLNDSEISFSEVKIELDKNTDEVNKLSAVLEHQQEKVRKYLLKKDKSILKDNKAATTDENTLLTIIQNDTSLSQSSKEKECDSELTLEELKEEEKYLEEEFKKLENRLLRIKSKRESLSPPSTKLYSC